MMSVKTAKTWSSRLFSILLATAFLTLQWAPAHIHLSAHHDHNGSAHQHQAQVHAHHSTHETIDDVSPRQSSHTNIIELVHDCSSPKYEQQSHSPAALVNTLANPLPPVLLVSTDISGFTTSKLSYFEVTRVNPRAPPFTC